MKVGKASFVLSYEIVDFQRLVLWPAEDGQRGAELPLNPLWREIPSNCASLAETQQPQQTRFTQETIKTA